MIDLHIHGGFGVDVLSADAEELDRLSRNLKERGVTGYLPTLVPLSLEDTSAVTRRLGDYVRSRRDGDGRGAVPLGIHFEGPFVSHARCGALRRAHFLDGSGTGLDSFLDAIGDPPGRSMVTLAPEIPGGANVVRAFERRGFVISIGHTVAGVAALDEARVLGARHMTHFGNAMKPLHHRDVGPIGWGLLRDDVTVDVIADLAHLSPEMLRLVFKAKGASRVALISDAIPPAGLAPGSYAVWGETLTIADGTVRNATGALAGSAAHLDEDVANLIRIGIPEDDARRTASDVPRRVLAR